MEADLRAGVLCLLVGVFTSCCHKNVLYFSNTDGNILEVAQLLHIWQPSSKRLSLLREMTSAEILGYQQTFQQTFQQT